MLQHRQLKENPTHAFMETPWPEPPVSLLPTLASLDRQGELVQLRMKMTIAIVQRVSLVFL
jgi:hypothetical protein